MRKIWWGGGGGGGGGHSLIEGNTLVRTIPRTEDLDACKLTIWQGCGRIRGFTWPHGNPGIS